MESRTFYGASKPWLRLRFIDLTIWLDSDTVSTYQVSSVQLVTNKKLEAFNKA